MEEDSSRKSWRKGHRGSGKKNPQKCQEQVVTDLRRKNQLLRRPAATSGRGSEEAHWSWAARGRRQSFSSQKSQERSSAESESTHDQPTSPECPPWNSLLPRIACFEVILPDGDLHKHIAPLTLGSCDVKNAFHRFRLWRSTSELVRDTHEGRREDSGRG